MHGRSMTEPTDGYVYQAIKTRVVGYEFPQGERIYLEPIAKQLGVSTWPVREVFNHLAVEGLVVKAPRKGFFAPTLSEDNLVGQYQLTRHLLSLGLETLEPSMRRGLGEYEPIATLLGKLNRRALTDVNTLANYTGEVFAQIAALTRKSAIVIAIDRANDQLFYIRTIESLRLEPESVQTELICFCELLLAGDCVELIAEIRDYHEQRLAMLPELLELLDLL